MTARDPEPALELELEQPGNGRYWLIGKVGNTARAGADLYSRDGQLIGYLALYGDGWAVNSRVRSGGSRAFPGTGKARYRSCGGGYATAQDAANVLLEDRRRAR